MSERLPYHDGGTQLTSFWGGVDRGRCVQLDNGGFRLQLEEGDVGRLVDVLQDWLKRPKTYTVKDAAEIFGRDGERVRDMLQREGATVVLAIYESGGWEGSWCVVYVDKFGQWHIAAGGHCSCNGPEFEPQATTRDALLSGNPQSGECIPGELKCRVQEAVARFLAPGVK